jgi:hypothetical protein
MISKTKSFVMAAFALFAIVLVSGLGSAVTLAEWNFESSSLVPSTDITSGASMSLSNSRVADFSIAGNAPSVGKSMSSSTWNVAGEFIEVSISTLGYENLILSFDEEITGTGPTEFKIQYSSDGGITFTDLPGSTTSTTVAFDTNPMHTFDLSAISAIENNAGTKLRILVPSSGIASDPAGKLRIDNVLITGSAVPSPLLSVTPSGTLSTNSNGTIVVKNDGNVALNLVVSETSSFGATFSSTTIPTLAPGVSSAPITVSLPSGTNLKFGDNTVKIKAEDSTKGVSKTANFVVQKSFCKAGEAGGNLILDRVRIDNQGEGDDDEWLLLDTIEIEVKIENDGTDDIDDVFIELGLFDSSGRNQINDMDFDNVDDEEADLGKIRDGKDETFTFTFRIPADVEDGSYKLAVKAYSDDLGEANECVDSSEDDLSNVIYESISIDRESDEGKFIAFEDVIVSPSTVSCGESVSLLADIFNIGDEDQEQVKVNLRNTELGLEKFIEIRNDFDQGDQESIAFEFRIPNNAEDKTYQLRLSTQYDYKSGNYRESSEDDEIVLLTVAGCKPSTVVGPTTSGRIASIGAVLDSDAKAGEELVVRATVVSLMPDTADFIIGVKNYESWASSADISSRIVTLGSGNSKEVRISFDVKDDADGEESFIIEVSAGDEFEAREVAVNIKGSATGGSRITGSAIGLGDNAYLWIIGIINVILVILIIVVAVRISRR